MKVYNLEIFDINEGGLIYDGWSKYLNVYHHQISDLNYSFDYFKRENNTIEVPYASTIKERQVVRITDATNMEHEFVGIVSAVESSNNGLTKVTYSDFLNTFMDLSMVFDTSIQRSTGQDDLEKYLEYKTEEFASMQGWQSIDYGYQVSVRALTHLIDSWGFNIKPEIENTNFATINFKSVLIDRAATEFDVWIRQAFDRNYNISILKSDNTYKYIETNAPYVINKTIRFESNKDSTNVLSVFNAENGYSDFWTLQTDGSVVRGNSSNPVLPPIYNEILINLGEDQTYEQRAYDEAVQKMKIDTTNNYIEIEVPIDTSDFIDWEIGQKVKIIHEGNAIESVLTGFKINKTLTLIFGTIRLELTKRLVRNQT